MPGLVPGIHVFNRARGSTWMAGSSPAMTNNVAWPILQWTRAMPEIDLLRALPKTKRNVQARAEAKNPEVVRIAKEFGQLFFDGPRDYGYGGYRYDGRWLPVARDIVQHFGLKPGMRVLD